MNNYYELNTQLDYNTMGTCNEICSILPQNELYDGECNIQNKLIQLEGEFIELLNKDINISTEEIPETDILLEVINKFKKHQKEYIDACTNYKNEQQKTQDDVKLLRQSIDYLKKLNDKYENETNPLNDILKKNIETLMDTIKQNNNLKLTKDKYETCKKEMIKYSCFVKKINNFNAGSTCSLCFSCNVDCYFNPCGHTSCNNCIKKLKNKRENNCPFCKKKIINDHTLYFI